MNDVLDELSKADPLRGAPLENEADRLDRIWASVR